MSINIKPFLFQGSWNYTIHPHSISISIPDKGHNLTSLLLASC